MEIPPHQPVSDFVRRVKGRSSHRLQREFSDLRIDRGDPQKRRLGYARVSTYGQTVDAQLQQFRAEGCAKVYREKASGAAPTAPNCAASSTSSPRATC